MMQEHILDPVTVIVEPATVVVAVLDFVVVEVEVTVVVTVDVGNTTLAPQKNLSSQKVGRA